MNGRKQKVLLVYPRIPTTYWSFEHAIKFLGKTGLMPPLGLITVAAMLPENFECTLVDLNINELIYEDVLNADLVFISAMIVQKESFAEVVELCNRAGTPVVAGGPYPTALHDTIDGVDHFVLNEAEITLPLFLEDFEKGQAQKIYTSTDKPCLGESPVPRFDLLDINAYSDMAIQTSRGCPFSCEFCDIIEMFGRTPRYKSPDQVMTELQSLYDLGYRGPVFVVDDNFIGNRKVVKELIRELVSWQKTKDYPFTFFTEASINLAHDEELMDLMVEASFEMVFIGIETPDMETLKRSHKMQNLKGDLLDSVNTIQKKGIEVMAGFILGFDTDGHDIFDRQISFIQKAGIPIAMMGLLEALPGTQLYRRLEREGRILGESDGNNTHKMDTNFVTVMPKKQLIRGYHRVISELYKPQSYLERCQKMILQFPDRPMAKYPVGFSEIRALFMSLIKQGFSSYGLLYFKYLLSVLANKPRHLPHALNLAVKGHHFFKITKDILELAGFNDLIENSETSLETALYEIIQTGKRGAGWKIHIYGTMIMRKIRFHYGFLNNKLKGLLSDRYQHALKKCENLVLQYSEMLKKESGINIRKAS